MLMTFLLTVYILLSVYIGIGMFAVNQNTLGIFATVNQNTRSRWQSIELGLAMTFLWPIMYSLFVIGFLFLILFVVIPEELSIVIWGKSVEPEENQSEPKGANYTRGWCNICEDYHE